MINVFIPHRWNNDDYSTISSLLDRTKFKVRDYSVPASSPFDSIDRRYNVDPQIQKYERSSTGSGATDNLYAAEALVTITLQQKQTYEKQSEISMAE